MSQRLRVFSPPVPSPKLRILLLLLGTVLAAAYVIQAGLSEPSSAGVIVLCLLGPTMAAVDIRERRLPDILTLITGIAAFIGAVTVCALQEDWTPLGTAALSALVTTGVFYLVALLSAGGFGLGDIKLIAVITFSVGLHGWQLVFYSLAAAFILGAIVALVLRLVRTKTGEIPFGPFLVIAAIITGFSTPTLG